MDQVVVVRTRVRIVRDALEIGVARLLRDRGSGGEDDGEYGE